MHIVITIVIGWILVKAIRAWLQERAERADMARRIIPNGPPPVWPVDCSAAGIARIQEARRVAGAKARAEGEALLARLNAEHARQDAAAAEFEAANPYWRLQLYAPKGEKL